MEELKSKLKDAIEEAISNVSCDTDMRYFVGNTEFVVEDGWVKVEITGLKNTE